jgi:hypothetical protein
MLRALLLQFPIRLAPVRRRKGLTAPQPKPQPETASVPSYFSDCKAIHIEINATFVIAALPAVEHNFAVGTQGDSICHAAK